MKYYGEEEFIDLEPEEIVDYIFEELVDMGLVSERQYLHIVLDLLVEFFIEKGLIEDE